jgi:predicted metal-dependent phosphoesterase TrpH
MIALRLVLADLHIHSTVSDGWLDPAEAIHTAVDRGMALVALSDHDSFFGLEEARRMAALLGVAWLPAVEVTTAPPLLTRHILGHGVDPTHPQLEALARRTQGVLRAQSMAYLDFLRKRGVTADFSALLAKPHLMPGAILKEVLQEHLLPGREALTSVGPAVDFLPAEVYAPMPGPEEVVAAIHAAGGIAVLAHPGTIKDKARLDEVLPLVDGLEVYTRRHRPEQIPFFLEMARTYKLLVSSGSDFHAFRGEVYAGPTRDLDPAYLERLRPHVVWPENPAARATA